MESRQPLSGIPGYVTPSIAKVAGEDHLVMITGSRGPRPQCQRRKREWSRPTQRQGAVDLFRLAVHHPGTNRRGCRRGPPAHHRCL